MPNLLGSIELGDLMADGQGVARTYADEVTGFSGIIAATLRNPYVQVDYCREGTLRRHALFEADSRATAETIVTEETAAVSAIGNVLAIVSLTRI